MAEMELLDEIDALKDQIESLQSTVADVKFERDTQVAELEDKNTRIREEVETEWKKRLISADRDHREKVEELVTELDLLRNAFSGDVGGWEEKKLKGGMTSYQNSETGEIRDSEPEVLYIAKAMKRVEEADSMMDELKQLKTKYKDLEIKKREGDLIINRVKTEINSLKSVDRLWKNASAVIFTNLNDVKNQFDAQADQVIQGLSAMSKAGHRMHQRLPLFSVAKNYIAELQQRVRQQEAQISALSSQVRAMQSDIDEKGQKIKRLSAGLDEEIERLTKPIRDKLADCMVVIMKEKAARAQERRDIADLWPDSHLMPTLLMKYRALTPEERDRRIQASKEKSASLALSLEIIGNVAESRKWELKYDDYGRAYYQHTKTGETSWDEPEICKYAPPPGRNEMGNIVYDEVVVDEMAQWQLNADSKGQIFYRHKDSGEISFFPPSAYAKIPEGKSALMKASEAAKLVLSFIKSRIVRHMKKMKKIRHDLLNPISPEDRAKQEKLNKYNNAIDTGTASEEAAGDAADDGCGELTEAEEDELSQYLYDIETVELLAAKVEDGISKGKDYDPEVERKAKHGFLDESDVRLFDVGNYTGPTLYETDVTIMTVPELRALVEHLAVCEEKLDLRLARTRDNLKDFSYVLMEKQVEFNKERAEALELESVQKAQKRMEQLKKERAAEKRNERKKKRLDDKKTTEHERMLDIAEGIDLDGHNRNNATFAGDMSVGGDTSTAMTAMTETIADDDEKKKLAKNQDDFGDDNDDVDDDAESVTSELTGAEGMGGCETDIGALLVGDPDLDPSEPDFSDETINMSSNLVNFTLFCGYTDLRIDSAPEDVTLEFSLNPDDANKALDDTWLTASFYLSCSKDRVDGIRMATAREYDPDVGSLSDSNLQTLQLSEEAITGSRDKMKPWSPGVAMVDLSLKSHYALWKSRQLMAEVLRHQLQQEAVRDAVYGKLRCVDDEKAEQASPNLPRLSLMTAQIMSGSKYLRDQNRPVELHIKKLVVKDVSSKVWVDQQRQYVQFTLGRWVTRCSSEIASGRPLIWNDLVLKMLLPLENIQLDDLLVEVFDEGDLVADVLIARARVSISSLLGYNTGHDMEFTVSLVDRRKRACGCLTVTLSVDQSPPLAAPLYDPQQLAHKEILNMSHPTNEPLKVKLNYGLNHEEDALSGVYPSLQDQLSNFGDMVADYRGDGDKFIKMFTGDIGLPELLNKGYRINELVVKKLPNFTTSKAFLRRKTSIHTKQVEAALHEIEETYTHIEQALQEKFDASQTIYAASKKKYQSLLDSAENTRSEVKRINDMMNEVRLARLAPKEPIFPELPEIPYVMRLPATGGLDAKGKKKKQIPKKDLQALCAEIEAGERDAVEWDFDPYWPTQAQGIAIGKSTSSRNNALDNIRVQELEKREKLMESYRGEVLAWEVEERLRKAEFDKARKESRKINLKLDCYMERSDRIYQEYAAIELDANTFKGFKEIHEKSKERFRTMRMKQYLESDRQGSMLHAMKKRLLKAVDARRRALEAPSLANRQVDFESLRKKSEESLRILRFEIVDCKECLMAEGVRLRERHHEENSCSQNELNRVRMLREIVAQRVCLDKIIERNRYEVLHLMESMEKLRLFEAEKDDRGLKHTVDDLGERYIFSRPWDSPEIEKCTRLIDLCMAKINLCEGINISASNCQKCLVEAVSVKWGVDFAPTRNSWVEKSDYERSQRLLQDILQWAAAQRQKLADRDKETFRECNELRLQLAAAVDQHTINLTAHENESNSVTSSASNIVSVMQRHLDNLREAAKSTEIRLEKSITDLSRECQKVREDLLAQALFYEEKAKVLWAIIRTLQATVQTISAKMEVFLEERDKIVIASKLESDKMRLELRTERKHCANLLFIIHYQRGTVKYYQDLLNEFVKKKQADDTVRKLEKSSLRKQIWDNVFSFTRLCTDVDALFEFFASRLANIAGSRKSVNDSLAFNGAAQVLSALCKSPKPIIRKYAARALGAMGWDSFVETRILLWDCVMYWKLFQHNVVAKESQAYSDSLQKFCDTGKYEAILNLEGQVDEFVASGNVSLRTMIKQRRQWALRVATRKEGPNILNQGLINIKDGVINSLLDLCVSDAEDWEIARNAALAISVASFEVQNHKDMVNDTGCVRTLLKMCEREDPEVKTHAVITIANLTHMDEHAQAIFGNSGVIPILLSMCSTHIVDVLEAVTAALSNLTCFCDANCKRVMDSNGIKAMIDLIASSYSENLLDMDQNDEVHANASEMLANVSRFSCDETTQYFNGYVIDALVFMCASPNKQVKRHAPLVVGNIAQSQRCREEIGDRGGVESMFLVLEDKDTTIQANALWALCNLMWHPPNQERAGRFMPEVVTMLSSSAGPVKTYACTLLANLLYYNSSNRVRFLETEGAMELVMLYISQRDDPVVAEGCLRSVLSLSYLDQIAMWLGKEGNSIPFLISLLHPPYLSRNAMRYCLEIICNLCIHHENRRLILENAGIEALVNLQSDEDVHIRELAVQILDHLEDVTPAEVLARVRQSIGLERMVSLANDKDPLVRAMAAESIGEEVWHDPKKQARANQVGGVDALLAIVANANEPVDSVLPSLWSLRNLMHQNPEAQVQFGFRDGISVVMAVLSTCISNRFHEQSEKVVEAVLACLMTAITNQERNSRRLLVVGLEAIMDIADAKLAVVTGAALCVRQAMCAEGVVALAKFILLMLGPYNYVVCINCHKKQDLHGTSCVHCGYKLLVDVADKEHMTLAPVKKRAGSTGTGTGHHQRAAAGSMTTNTMMQSLNQSLSSAAVADQSARAISTSASVPSMTGIKDLRRRSKMSQSSVPMSVSAAVHVQDDSRTEGASMLRSTTAS